MLYFFILSLTILIPSFLIGALTKQYAGIKSEYFSFSTPIGFLMFLGLCQIGFFIVSYYKLDPQLYKYYYVTVIGGIFFLSLFKFKWIIAEIQKIKLWKLILSLFMVGTLVFLFSKVEINFRLDDLNFYGDYVANRLSYGAIGDIQYGLQGIFIILSILSEQGYRLANFGIYTDFFPIATVIWIPAILSAWMISFTLVDFMNYVKDKFKSRAITCAVAVSVTVIFFLDTYFIGNMNSTLVLRKFAMPIILILFSSLSVNNERLRKPVVLALILSGFIGISSSSFFISAILLICYLGYVILTKKENYLRQLLIISIAPLIFCFTYIEQFIKVQNFIYLLSLVYVVCSLIVIFKLDKKIEGFLNKYGTVIIAGFCLAFLSLAILKDWDVIAMVGNRTFFTPISNFDMVPDLLNGYNVFGWIFISFFWIFSLLAIVKMVIKKDENYVLITFLIVIVLFFNPFVYKMIAFAMTGAAYFRITDILFNIVILYEIIFQFKKYEKVTIVFLVILVFMKFLSYGDVKYNNSSDFNSIYHISDNEIKIMQKLDKEYLQIDDDSNINIASQIYGGQFFTFKEINNQLEDRFSYFVREVSEFERVFYRRTPGYDDLEVDYEHACTLASMKETDYVILDAQYNWQLQEGLWSCSEVLFEEDNYRVLKMNYDYWEWNIKEGYVEKYDLTGQ